MSVDLSFINPFSAKNELTRRTSSKRRREVRDFRFSFSDFLIIFGYSLALNMLISTFLKRKFTLMNTPFLLPL